MKTNCRAQSNQTSLLQMPRACVIGIYTNFSPRSGRQRRAHGGARQRGTLGKRPSAVKPTEWATAIDFWVSDRTFGMVHSAAHTVGLQVFLDGYPGFRAAALHPGL